MRELQKKEEGWVKKKERKKKKFAMSIIFKELRTGPRTRISKMENAGVHRAVGKVCSGAYKLLLRLYPVRLQFYPPFVIHIFSLLY